MRPDIRGCPLDVFLLKTLNLSFFLALYCSIACFLPAFSAFQILVWSVRSFSFSLGSSLFQLLTPWVDQIADFFVASLRAPYLDFVLFLPFEAFGNILTGCIFFFYLAIDRL